MTDKVNYIGRQFGNYRVIEKLPIEGGFGSIYKGKHIIFSARPIVVIKLLHPHLVEREQKRFSEEAQLLDKLKHPYILPIIEAGIEEGIPYYIAEYAMNGSLRDRLQKQSPNPLSIEEAMVIISQIGQALQHAHQQARPVVHRDLKPGNILFNDKGEALLADFGIAVVLDAARTQSVEDISGSWHYMAPEQFEGNVSIKSDQYALGCIVYELVTGRRPFNPRSTHIGAWALAHMTQKPTPPTQFNPYLPLHIEQSILKAMEKQREDRYASIADFLTALGIPSSQKNISNIHHTEISSDASPDIPAMVEIDTFKSPKKLIEQWLEEGEDHFEAKRYEEALTAFERVIRFDSKSADAYYQIGKVLEQSMRPWEAINAYNQAIHLNPKFADACIGKGNIYSTFFKNHEKALDEYQEATRVSPKLAPGYYKMGNELIELKRYEEALAAFEAAIRYEPRALEAYYQKINVLVLLERYDNALSSYDQIIALAPGATEAYYQKISLLEHLKRYDDALITYEWIIQRNPDSINVYLKKIDLLKSLGYYDRALLTYNRIIQQAPDFIDAYYQKVDLLQYLGRENDALKTYDQIIQLIPDPINVYYKKINLLKRLKFYDEALTTYERIIQLAPEVLDTYHEKIELLEHLKYYNEALATYDRTIKYTSDVINVYYQKINLLKSIERFGEAITIYDQIIECAPETLDPYYEKIELLEHLKRYDEALLTYDQMADIAPNPVHVYHQKIDLLEQLERYPDILIVFDRIIELAPSILDTYYQKIDLLRQLDRCPDILVVYDQLISLTPNPIEIYFEKTALLERLERYEDALEIYDSKIIKQYPTLAVAHYRKGLALENYAKTRKRKPLIGEEYLPQPVQTIIARLLPDPLYKEALSSYDDAIKYSSNNVHYGRRRENVLKSLGKINEAKKLIIRDRDWIDQIPDIAWYNVLVVFNTLCISIPLALWQRSWGVLGGIFLAGSFLLSALFTLLMKKIDKPHHLYEAYILFLPAFFFGPLWVIISWLLFPSFFSFTLTVLFGFLVNAFVPLLIDIFGINIFRVATLSLLEKARHFYKEAVSSLKKQMSSRW